MKLMRLWLLLLAVPGSENWLYAVLDEATEARLLGAEKTLDAVDEACDATESRLPVGKRWSGMDELRRVRGIEPISVVESASALIDGVRHIPSQHTSSTVNLEPVRELAVRVCA